MRFLDLKKCYLKKAKNIKDIYSGQYHHSFEEDGNEVWLTIQSTNAQHTSLPQGISIQRTKTAYYQGEDIQEGRNEGDGIVVEGEVGDQPNYRILTIEDGFRSKKLILLKLNQDDFLGECLND
jgi:hypothetical protein